MKILAIETSCDETSVAVVENGTKVHSLVVNSQIDLHKAFGGVVPEVAARSHIEVMLPVITQALEEAFGESTKFQVSNSKQIPLPNNQNPKHDLRQTNHDFLPTTNNQLWTNIDAIAVTQGPGLLGSLLIGVLTARTLAWSLNKPLVPVHHILGHVYANWITSWQEPANPKLETLNTKQIRNPNNQNTTHDTRPTNHDLLSPTNHQLPTQPPEFPVLALIVSGGHTQLMYATNHTDWRVIGRTTDDAVGEAFDKAAKVLGLPYPGGISLSKVAQNGDPTSHKLPIPNVTSVDPGLLELRSQFLDLSIKNQRNSNGHDNPPASQNSASTHTAKLQTTNYKLQTTSYNFSFSGLKTAFLRAVQKECGKDHTFASFELAALLSEHQKANLAASFESTAIQYLVTKTNAAFEEFRPKTFILGGGVAASLPLRDALSKALPLKIEYAPQILCTDNAAMIGARAYFQLQTEDSIDPCHLEVKPSWPL